VAKAQRGAVGTPEQWEKEFSDGLFSTESHLLIAKTSLRVSEVLLILGANKYVADNASGPAYYVFIGLYYFILLSVSFGAGYWLSGRLHAYFIKRFNRLVPKVAFYAVLMALVVTIAMGSMVLTDSVADAISVLGM
jgi:hypothetical protein